jgi:ribosomal protein S18 acetylase RimI-like enzyme
MTEKILAKLNIRTYQHTDMEDVIHVWDQCGLIRSWNNPKLDIQRKVNSGKDLFFVGELSNKIIATAMFGYDGHRGWLNYFAVLPQLQKSSFGKQLLEFGEKILVDKGCPKLNLQIRADNKEAINFYKAVGYVEDEVISFGKRLIRD